MPRLNIEIKFKYSNTKIKFEHLNTEISDYTISNSECEKLLCVKTDVNINFNNHIFDLCKKASRKISALGRVGNY